MSTLNSLGLLHRKLINLLANNPAYPDPKKDPKTTPNNPKHISDKHKAAPEPKVNPKHKDPTNKPKNDPKSPL